MKELRLQQISTVDAANAFMPTFIDDYNRRFGKLPRDRHDAHRLIRKDEDLHAIFAWREYRKVTDSLTLRYERTIYLIQDTPSNRRLIGKYIEVFQLPDGRIEIRIAGESLPYSTYDKLGTIDQGAIVDNKRLSHVLRTSQAVQASRDNRVVHRPSTAHRVDGTPIPKNKLVGAKRQRDLSEEDLHSAIKDIKLDLVGLNGVPFDVIDRNARRVVLDGHRALLVALPRFFIQRIDVAASSNSHASWESRQSWIATAKRL